MHSSSITSEFITRVVLYFAAKKGTQIRTEIHTLQSNDPMNPPSSCAIIKHIASTIHILPLKKTANVTAGLK